MIGVEFWPKLILLPKNRTIAFSQLTRNKHDMIENLFAAKRKNSSGLPLSLSCESGE